MFQIFSTEVLPASDRIDAWQWNAKQICGDCQIRYPKFPFHGSIDIRSVGELRLTQFASSALSFGKWPCLSSNPEDRFFIVVTQLAGLRSYTQDGTTVVLRPGDTTLIDAGKPWSSDCVTDCVRLYLRVPQWVMETQLQRASIPVTRRIDGDSPTGAVLFRVTQSLYSEAGQQTPEEERAALDAYFEVLAACTGNGRLMAERAQQLRWSIQRYIDGRLSDPGLSAKDIASAIGISVRHLHRVFLATGSTMGDYLRAQRLEGCRRDLVDPKMRDKTITEIAFYWGFADSAHFSHAFRKRFGLSPRTFRSYGLDGQHKSWNLALEIPAPQPTRAN